MAVTVTHALVSVVPDDGVAGEVGPNEWNDNHVIVGLGTAAEADSTDFATAAQGALADTALQSADIANMLETSDIGVTVQAHSAVLDATTASFLTAHATKLGHITVTQAVDLDAVETAAAASKVKTDFISVTQAVDLDAIETRVNALDAAVILRGSWDASAGTFPGGGTAQAGDSYIVSVAGTVNSVAFALNDRIIAITDNASTTTFAANWFKADYTDQVLSVAGRTGAVTLAAADLTDITATATELNYTDGVTSAIQTQLDAKVGGSTGGTDNRLLRADGTGGVTAQNSAVTVDDSGNMSGLAQVAGQTLFLQHTSAGVTTKEAYIASAFGVREVNNKSRGATVGTNTIVQSGDELWGVFAQGANGTGFTQGGFFGFYVDGTPGASNDMPTRLVIGTTPDGSGTAVERLRVDSRGATTITGSFGRGLPVTKTADFTVADTENWLINNKAGSSCVVTLPSAAAWGGREIMFKNSQAQTVTSASSSVVPRVTAAAGTAILASGSGNWCTMVSDGTNWVIMQGS